MKPAPATPSRPPPSFSGRARSVLSVRVGRWLLTSSLVLSALVGSSAWAATRCADILVSPVSFALTYHAHGYVEHKVRLRNLSGARTHTVRLVCPNRSYGMGEHISRLERTVVLGPLAEVTVTLPQPPLPLQGDTIVRVIVDRVERGRVELSSLRQQHYAANRYGGGRQAVSVLISRRVNTDDLNRALTDKTSVPSGYSPLGNRDWGLTKSEHEPVDWSDSWLAYTCYDGVVLYAEELQRMPPAVRRALWAYAEAGGCLTVLGSLGADAVPATWRTLVTDTLPGVRMFQVGFGQCRVYAQSEVKQLNAAQVSAMKESWFAALRPWGQVMDVAQAHKIFPVVDDIRIPVRGLFLIMLGFSIVIGPVNLLVLARRRKRIWLLWTVPAVSLLAAALVFAYSVLAEGITPTIRMSGITVLDETTRQATTLGLAAYYCPLTPAQGLHFGYETEITPQVTRSGYGAVQGRRSVDWSRDQHLDSGWITARTPAHFLVRKSESRRERLRVFRDDEGALLAVNGLGARISVLWVADTAGRLYVARGIGAGRRAALTRSSMHGLARGRPSVLAEIYKSDDWHKQRGALAEDPAEWMWPGTYVAVLDESPFMELGLDGRAKKRLEAVVLGLMAEPPAGP